LLIMFTARRSPRAVRLIAAGTTGISAVLSLWIYVAYDRETAGFQFYEKVPLVPPLGLYYEVGVDGISLLMVLLTSIIILVGILALYVNAGSGSFSFLDFEATAFPRALQRWVFLAFYVGFGVLAGIWPLHTWSPDGHASAPTAVSMLHAGVLMKLGAYGVVRVGMGLLPDGRIPQCDAGHRARVHHRRSFLSRAAGDRGLRRRAPDVSRSVALRAQLVAVPRRRRDVPDRRVRPARRQADLLGAPLQSLP